MRRGKVNQAANITEVIRKKIIGINATRLKGTSTRNNAKESWKLINEFSKNKGNSKNGDSFNKLIASANDFNRHYSNISFKENYVSPAIKLSANLNTGECGDTF